MKVIFDKKTGQLLGAHIVGAEVTELIQGYVIATDSRDHGRRADAHRVPASDLVGDDEGSGARCLRPGAEYLIRYRPPSRAVRIVIASEAKQSNPKQWSCSGLLRRCAPRNDGVAKRDYPTNPAIGLTSLLPGKTLSASTRSSARR